LFFFLLIPNFHSEQFKRSFSDSIQQIKTKSHKPNAKLFSTFPCTGGPRAVPPTQPPRHPPRAAADGGQVLPAGERAAPHAGRGFGARAGGGGGGGGGAAERMGVLAAGGGGRRAVERGVSGDRRVGAVVWRGGGAERAAEDVDCGVFGAGRGSLSLRPR